MYMDERALGLDFDGAFFTSGSEATAQNRLGMCVAKKSPEGWRVFKYLKAEEAFAIGQVAAMSQPLDNADVDEAASTSSTKLKGTGDFTAGEYNDDFPNSFVTVDAGSGLGQTRLIRGNRGSTDFLDLEANNPWDVALDTTSDYVTYNPNYVSLADTDDFTSVDDCVVKGVAISAISDEEFGWFQVGGLCPLIRGDGSSNPFEVGSLIIPTATAGVASGPTSGGITALEAAVGFGIAQHPYAGSDAAGRGVCGIINCRFGMF